MPAALTCAGCLLSRALRAPWRLRGAQPAFPLRPQRGAVPGRPPFPAAARRRARPAAPPEIEARARRRPRGGRERLLRRRGAGRRSREARFYGVAGGRGPGRGERGRGEAKRHDWTREAAGAAVGRGPRHRAGSGPCWRRGVGLTLPAGESGHGVCYRSRSASCSEARPEAAVPRRRRRGRSPLRACGIARGLRAAPRWEPGKGPERSVPHVLRYTRCGGRGRGFLFRQCVYGSQWVFVIYYGYVFKQCVMLWYICMCIRYSE